LGEGVLIDYALDGEDEREYCGPANGAVIESVAANDSLRGDDAGQKVIDRYRSLRIADHHR